MPFARFTLAAGSDKFGIPVRCGLVASVGMKPAATVLLS
jgi:hypothetical protein